MNPPAPSTIIPAIARAVSGRIGDGAAVGAGTCVAVGSCCTGTFAADFTAVAGLAGICSPKVCTCPAGAGAEPALPMIAKREKPGLVDVNVTKPFVVVPAVVGRATQPAGVL